MAALDLTYEAYINLNGGEHCGICQAGPPPSRRLDRDHDHVTGKPRGLLCRKHNRQVKRWLTLEFARLVVDYLERTIVKFQPFTDVELDHIAVAFTSAGGEGAFSNRGLAEELAAEYDRRERLMPTAYRQEPQPAHEWLDAIIHG